MAKRALGKGLDALISVETDVDKNNINEILLDDIVPNKNQPRKKFEEEGIKELAESIKENGIIQPIVVRKINDKYQIVIGERRYRAAKLIGLKKIPAVIRDVSDSKTLELALIENIQREDLNPIEEASAYKTIIDREMITQEELSRKIGKSRSYIANMIRLLELPEKVKEYVSRGTISVGHAKAILSVKNPDEQIKIAKEIINKGYSVRDVEGLTKRKNVSRGTYEKNPYIAEIEEKLIDRFGTKVRINYKDGKGSLIIDFYSEEDLERILENLL